ncbi:MAG: double-strand break repair protein AddB [Hyphomonas sp.]|uniref:double-strand break repair protein AddB n=1 Tax=Hyphomonas sp. TaxID=87 RepID=UPI0035299504
MADKSGLFSPGQSRVWTIPPGADFLRALAEVLVDEAGLKDKPDALADAIIYVPNRRSARKLAHVLFEAAGGRPILPPDIRTLGDVEADEAPSADAARSGLPPAMSQARRLGALTWLVQAYYERVHDTVPPASSALAAAQELSRLMEQAAHSDDVKWDKLPGLAGDTELATHWEKSVEFLGIVAQAWPAWLAENGEADPFERDAEAAALVAAAWKDAPPSAPVIIAGSTGATPAGRILMRAAMNLPKGLIVLPGLDTHADEGSRQVIAGSVSHPQHILFETLKVIGVIPEDVQVWSKADLSGPANARRRLIHEALAPAEATADWRRTLKDLARGLDMVDDEFARIGLSGLSVIETPDESVEADVAALLLRQALEAPDATAALVTPDATLARRVSAVLKRWGVDVPPSSGAPLGQTTAGSLIGLCARWVLDPADPVALSAVLKHPFVEGYAAQGQLDLYFLRGARNWTTLEDLEHSIEERREIDPYGPFDEADQAEASALVGRLMAAFAETGADLSRSGLMPGRDIAQKIASLAEYVSQTPFPWAGEDGRAATQMMEYVADLADHLNPMMPEAMVSIIEAEAARRTVSAGVAEHPRLAIWGPLEARLQSATHIILAGLNEDVWPQRPPADAFLPRRFREAIGLGDPEERVGLSAHDFAQLACAPKVTLLHAARRDDAPAVASRWVWRLKTLAQGALGDAAKEVLAPSDAAPLDWALALRNRSAGKLPPDFAEPRPTRRDPDDWPGKLSVTRIDTLQRDPYAIWAEQVLGLKTLEPMNAELGPAPRGTAIHKAIELFELEDAPKSAARLQSLLAARLSMAGEPEPILAARGAILRRMAEWYVDWRANRLLDGKPWLEVSGSLDFEFDDTPFRLTGTADRIERRPDGSLVIVDFKTGNPPTDKEINVGLSQQMPLQAMMAARGAYKDVPAAEVSALEYVAMKAKPEERQVGQSRALQATPTELARLAEEGLARLILAYRNDDAVFLSAPRVQFVKYDNGFNRLARRAEWAGDTDDGGGDE